MEEFSEGYYRAEMDVQPYDNGPTIQDGLHDYIKQSVYGKTDAPITMRIGLDSTPYIQPSSEHTIPSDVLALPEKWMKALDLDESRQDVFLLKPGHSYIVNQSIVLQERFDNHNVSDV